MSLSAFLGDDRVGDDRVSRLVVLIYSVEFSGRVPLISTDEGTENGD